SVDAAGVCIHVALAFLLALAVYVARDVARPVRVAAGAAKRMAAGDLTGRLPLGGPGEIGELEQALNSIADSLQRALNELEERNQALLESEQLKTELVSNVSH